MLASERILENGTRVNSLPEITLRYLAEATDHAHVSVAEAVKTLASSFDGPGLVNEQGCLAQPRQQMAALMRARNHIDMAIKEVVQILSYGVGL